MQDICTHTVASKVPVGPLTTGGGVPKHVWSVAGTCGIIYGAEHVLSPPNGQTQSEFGLLSAASTTTTTE